jgi:deazaflavin-dependent oxidoreductase (nitroreductase family)
MKPYRDARPLHRLMRRTAATRPMAKLYGVIQQPLDRFVFRVSRGRTTASSWLGGVEITMLTTTGRKSGLPRTLPVFAIPDGDAMILIASNFGRPHHPSWYHNLRADPHAVIVFEGRRREVTARELNGAERDRCYRRAEEMYPGFIAYPRWAGERRIPVLRLEPAVSST